MRFRKIVEVIVEAETSEGASEVINNEIGLCCLGRVDEEEDYVSEPHIVDFTIVGEGENTKCMQN